MRDSRPPRGFTLIEVLTATGIMTVVILVVLSLTTNVLNIWNRSTGKLSANYEARVALDILARDLESMILRNRDQCWLEVIYAEPNGADVISDYQDAVPQTASIYLLAPVIDRPRYNSTGNEILGDVCLEVFSLAYRNPFTGSNDSSPPPLFGLYRFVVDAENTFEHVLSIASYIAAPNQNLLSGLTPQYYDEDGNLAPSTALLDVSDSDSTIFESENFLSANIVDFQIIFWYRRLTDGTFEALTNSGDATGDPISFVYANGIYRLGTVDKIVNAGPLEFADITITVMSEEGMALVENADATDTTEWHELVAQYSTTFTRRIQIMSRPL